VRPRWVIVGVVGLRVLTAWGLNSTTYRKSGAT
jgi:hypothetical protein